MTRAPLPTDRPILAWYGDDFTGSGAVMEVLTFAGLPAVLFLEPPTPEMLSHFPGIRAVGLASDSRTRSPAWMRAELPAAFAALRATGAPILHYKICSTLDSAPGIGSIGAAAEVGLPSGGLAPLVVAAPQIGRWQAFGTLFARAGDGTVHRLDRHPTMSVHPVTPMHEADVLRHIAGQTKLPTSLIDLVDLKAGRGRARLAEAMRRGGIVALDVVDNETLAAAGALLWQSPGFVLGSQGIEYALVAHWQAAGLLAPPPSPKPLAPVDRVAIVSGSCSPVTAAQIDRAEAAGYEIIPLDPRDPDWAAAGDVALACLARGRSPLVATARGGSDPGVTDGASLGQGLGRLLDRLVRETGLTRAVIAGGDTSSHAARALGLVALTAETPIAPGAALLRGHRADGTSLEIALKGGQMGGPDYFVRVRDGHGPKGGAAAA
jgi:3-oxoisoapionate kinase